MKVPKGWNHGSLGDVISKVRGGYSVKCDDRQAMPDEMAVLKTGAVLNGRFDLSQNKYVPPSEHASLRTPVKAGTIIFCRKNSEETIGSSALVSTDAPNVFLSDLLWELHPAPSIDRDWLANSLKSDRLRKLIQIEATGTQSTMKNISQDRLLNIPVAIPSLPEQRKIAEILRTWDEAIEKLEPLRAAKEQQFRGLQQKLIDQDFKSYGDTLEQYALIPNLEKIASVDGLRPLTVKLHCKGIMANGRNVPVTLSDKGRPYYRRKAGDFLIGRQNFHNGGFGIVPPELNGFIASNAITSLRIDSSKADVHYLFYFFSRKDYYLRIGHIMDGTGQKELSDKQIRKLPVSIPSLEKQVEVVQILNAANEEISLIDTKIEAITRQKRGLMQKLLTGEWRVTPEGSGA